MIGAVAELVNDGRQEVGKTVKRRAEHEENDEDHEDVGRGERAEDFFEGEFLFGLECGTVQR